MISNSQSQHPAHDRLHNTRWQSLSADEKLQEFRELTKSPYWHILPNEIKTRIQTMVTTSLPPSLRG